MFVHQIKIENYRGFELQQFDFSGQFTTLIGDNGSGKTSILDAVAFAIGTFLRGVDGVDNIDIKSEDKRQVFVSPNSLEYKLPLKIGIEHEYNSQRYHWIRAVEKVAANRATFADAKDFITDVEAAVIKVRAGEPVDLPLLALYGVERLSLHKPSKGEYGKVGSRLDAYRGCLKPNIDQVDFIKWFKSYEDAILKFGQDKSLYNAFVNAISSMVPDWTKIHFDWQTDDIMGQNQQGHWVPYRLLSSGYRGVIRFVADIAYRAIVLNPHLGEQAVVATQGVVLIDEIDMHLHPSWQKSIVADLKRTFPNIQFIVTTHSPFIIQSLKAEEVINLAGDVDEDPDRRSIEDIAEKEMAIENIRRSHKFVEMQQTAAKYFDLIAKGQSAKTNDEVAALKNQLDEIELEFNYDPAYVALMRAERKSGLGQ